MFTAIMKRFTAVGLMTLGFAAFADAQVCTPAPVGLVSWWSGDGNDLDSRSRHNSQSGANFLAGHVGQSFRVTGGDLAVRTSPSALNDAFPALTIEAWVNPASHGTDPSGIFGKTIISNTNGDGFALRLLNGVIQSDLRLTGGDARATFGPVLPLNTFSHVALTYDGANVRAYLNGVQVGSDFPASGTVRNTANSGICTFVGNDPSISCSADLGFGFDGRIDEISFYNRALSSSEIAAIHAAGTAGKCKPTATVAPSGLVASFAGDGDAKDTTGTNNGTLQSGNGFAIGRVGQAFNFAALPGVVAADNPVFNQQNFTIEMWATSTTYTCSPPFSCQAFLVAKSGSNGTFGWEIGVRENGTLRFSLNGAAGGADIIGNRNIADGNFHHIVGSYDGATMKIFVDGILDVQTLVSTTINYQANSPFHIGSRQHTPVTGSTVPHPGKIDEVSLYNRALTDAEIASIFNAGIAGKLKQTPTIDTNSLVSLWKGENNANDTRGANNGTFAVNQYAAGRIGQAFNFASSSPPGVVVPDNASLNPQTFTLEAWVTAGSYVCPGGSNTCQGFIIDKGGAFASSLVGYSLGVREAGTLRFLLNGGSGGADIITAQSVADGNFHHVAASYDGATMRVFVDGVLIAQRAVVTTITYEANSQFHIGSRQFLLTGSTVRHPGKIDEAAIYNRALSAAEVRANFEAGNAFSTRVGDATITFPSVTTAGTTQEIPLNRALLPPVPFGGAAVLAYDIATSAAFTGSPTVCFSLPTFNNPATFSELRVLHLESGVWQNRTTTSSFATRTLCGQVTSLSPFAIATLAPTAANASLSGRVTWGKDQGAPRVRVTVSGGDLPRPVTVTTNAFGHYRFDDLPAGRTYIVEVASKNLVFPDPARIVDLASDAADIDFQADSP